MKRTINIMAKIFAFLLISALIGACSLFGGGALVISGTVTGLQGTATLALSDGQEFSLTEDGPFSFNAEFDRNTEYEVSVLEWPDVQGWHIEGVMLSEDGSEISNIDLQFFYLYFFGADDGNEIALWKSDGTPEGTEKVKAFSSIYLSYVYANSRSAFLGDEVYFSGDDGTGTKLWKSDGTSQGTVSLGVANPSYLTTFQNFVFFGASDATHGDEVWRSDGTVSGTEFAVDVLDIGTLSSYPSHFAVLGDELLFSASEDPPDTELWKINGTTLVAERVKDIDGTLASSPRELTTVGNSVYFQAVTANEGYELFVSDGTTSGTSMVSNIDAASSSSFPEQFASLGDTVLFSASVGGDRELWKSDGTAIGTSLVKNIRSSGSSSPSELVSFDDLVYFRSWDENSHNEIWESDGTDAGTVLAIDISGASDSSNPRSLVKVGPRLVFFADHPSFGMEPWAFTPGAKATGEAELLKDIRSGINDSYLWEE